MSLLYTPSVDNALLQRVRESQGRESGAGGTSDLQSALLTALGADAE
jgi:hypothetical protein